MPYMNIETIYIYKLPITTMRLQKFISLALLMCVPLYGMAQVRPTQRPQTTQKPKTTQSPASKPKPVAPKNTIAGHAYVDLGLPSGLKWATCNIGATSPSGYGTYYSWGETATKSDWGNGGHCNENVEQIVSGNPTYDVARAKWGGSWRVPTWKEIQELQKNCTWTWTIQGGHKGYLVKGPNGKSIFLPAAGCYRSGTSLQKAGMYGCYWSSQSDPFEGYNAYALTFDSNGHYLPSTLRPYGFTVRAVSEENAQKPAPPFAKEISAPDKSISNHGYVDLGLPSGVKWATCNVDATLPWEKGKHYAWGETATKSDYSEKTCQNYRTKLEDISGNASYDVARAKWGDAWRLPNTAEMEELLKYCSWKTIYDDNYRGCLVTGPNGKSIFLPACGSIDGTEPGYDYGCGYYWSSTPYVEIAHGAHTLYFYLTNTQVVPQKALYVDMNRKYGFSVRPVYGTSKAEPTSESNQSTEQTASTPNNDKQEYVDLGLPSGLKWATCNIGASSPSEEGNYYAWGQTSKESSISTYEKDIDDFSGYPSHDAATANWGDSWRMPTKEECQELMEKCTWTWTSKDGHKGYLVKGPNGRSIFLPTTGDNWNQTGYYWTSTPTEDNGNAFGFYCSGEKYGKKGQWNIHEVYRKEKRPIRPVYKTNRAESAPDSTQIPTSESTQTSEQGTPTPIPVAELSAPDGAIAGHDYIDLGLPSGLKWATCNVGTSSPSEYGNYYAWGETSTKATYNEKNSKTYKKKMENIAGNSAYDAVRADWGGSWRLPTKTEYNELLNKCTWTWVNHSGHNGYLVTGPNGRSIFLPAVGQRYGTASLGTEDGGYYWSSTPRDNNKKEAYHLCIYNDAKFCVYSGRYYGNALRGVSE